MKGLYEKYKIKKACSSCYGTGFAPNTYFFACLDCNGNGYLPVPSDQKFFVLNLTTDPVARLAALTYAQHTDDEKLAADLLLLLNRIENRGIENV